MNSDDEGLGFGRGGFGNDSPERFEDRGGRRRSRSRGRDGREGGKGYGGDKGKGKGERRQRTTGREIPKLNSIHKATVVSIQSYGSFVRLGDGATYKDGLLHVSKISASGRIDAVSDVLSENDLIWVKVCEVNDDAQKFSVDMRYVRQRDGEDLDPNNTQAEAGRGKGGGKGVPEPIRIGAVQDTTCSRCGARGHMARECWSGRAGSNYALVEEEPEVNDRGVDRPEDAVPGVDPKIVKAALKAYMSRAPVDGSTGKSDKKRKKEEKKAEKAAKKALKKEKKKAKKAKKKAKKEKKADKAAKEKSTDKQQQQPEVKDTERQKETTGAKPSAVRSSGGEVSLNSVFEGVSSSSSDSSSSS